MVERLVDTFEVISRTCADLMAAQVRENPRSVLCLATGGSPLEAYRLFARTVCAEGIDLSAVTFVKLDEWHGPSMDDPSTCEAFLQRELYGPLGIRPEQTVSFDSQAADPEAECGRVAAMLGQLGGIDLCILGLGRNGHLGLNEPGRSLRVSAHVAQLAPQTREHAMLRETTCEVTRGMTLGMGDLIDARHIVMMVAGEGKETAYRGMLAGTVTTENPSSLLQLAARVTVLSAIGM